MSYHVITDNFHSPDSGESIDKKIVRTTRAMRGAGRSTRRLVADRLTNRNLEKTSKKNKHPIQVFGDLKFSYLLK